jgi:hypothetical protein
LLHNIFQISAQTRTYQNETQRVFISRKPSMIEYILSVTTISFSIYNIRESVRNASLILLRSLVLMIFMAENAHFVVTVKTRRVSRSTIIRKTSW